jgi:plasmid segregation protein ParM
MCLTAAQGSFLRGGVFLAKRVGLDVGYGFVKATDGAKGFSFPSVIGQGHEKPVFSTRMEKRPLIEDLKVSIGGDSYFVGRAAMRHAKYVQRDLSYTRAADGMFQVLVFSALSLFADGQQNEFKVVTGLPPERMHLMQDVEKRMQQRVTVTLHEGKRSKDIVCSAATARHLLVVCFEQSRDCQGRLKRPGRNH